MQFDELYKIARPLANRRQVSRYTEVASVSAAILAASGNVYTGVNIDTACSMGFCAEHSAIAAMATAGETKVAKVIAVHDDGKIIPPCGRCRQFLSQLDDENMNAEIMIADNVVKKLSELLPFDWARAAVESSK